MKSQAKAATGQVQYQEYCHLDQWQQYFGALFDKDFKDKEERDMNEWMTDVFVVC